MFLSLVANGLMQTDLSLSLTLYLLDVTLDDTRVIKGSENKVVRYMERKKNDLEVEDLQNTIDIKYKQTFAGSDSNNFVFKQSYINIILVLKFNFYF